jgi:hypothetical protein
VDFKASIASFVASGAIVPAKDGDPVTVKRIASGAVGGMVAPPTRCYMFDTTKIGVELPLDGA